MSTRAVLPILALIGGVFFLSACGETETYVPKPRAYHRLELPAKSYARFAPEACPFSFELPAYAEAARDTTYFGQPTSDACWFDLNFGAGIDAKVHLSYKPIDRPGALPQLIEDAYKLTSKHIRKADYIDDRPVHRGSVHGMVYEVGGDAASPMQFFLTDSTNHFLRGALYFNAVPNFDSIRPVLNFVQADLEQMMESFAWK